MTILLTGGAGFIGSCVLRTLNENGYEDIIVVDDIGKTDKWKHLVNKKYSEYYNKNVFLSELDELKGKISHVIHMGACSSTTENDFDYLYKNNYLYTKELWNYCADEKIPFIYASSAATYGSGECGFDDNIDINLLRPMNGYGYSKQLFDTWVLKQKKRPPQYVGLKFFNVYGPNEDCKGNMASVIYKTYNKVKKDGKMELFKSYDVRYRDGEQIRDFVYVKDICSVIMFFINNVDKSGLFNVGTGHARSFIDLVNSTFDSMCIPRNIGFIEMPIEIRDKYQYYTEAKIDKLRSVGYSKKFFSLEEGIRDYVQNYLMKDTIY